MSKYLIFSCISDYEIFHEGTTYACKSINRQTIEATSPLEAALNHIKDDWGYKDLTDISPEKLREHINSFIIIEVVGSAQTNIGFENTEIYKSLCFAHEEAENNKQKEKDLAELKRLQELYKNQ